MELTKINLLGEGAGDFFGDIFTLEFGPVRKTDRGFFYDLTMNVDPLFTRICDSVSRILGSFRWEEGDA